MELIDQLYAVTDPIERARTAGTMIEHHQAIVGEVSRVRREALEEMLANGMTQTQMANELDMTRGRISQLLSSGVKPERVILGTGKLTVAIGAKREANRTDPSDTLSAESFAAFELLADTARTYGLDASYEVIPPPGLVHLNQSNLIVLTNPRLLPFLSQVMEADPNIRYVQDETGWYLVDLNQGKEYRSPRDLGDAADYGYLGRLPRPDGKGSFLYLAGTHAPGTLGAAHYLVNNIPEIYREVKNKRFSAIIRYEFKPGDQLAKRSADRVTTLYRHES
ncbi:hypothetical protein AB0M50_09070 [Nonomuraea fuscirosea]|uniref:hypothetical protein n=1 Tax=Nonomuraea fuscirosea TaxID=1291556 RepID=UPI003423E873